MVQWTQRFTILREMRGRKALEEKLEVLYRYFGYSSFRRGQEELIDAQLWGRDAFGIMPTGGGKSLCYQIPALMLEGITLVVSPLISLMKDQVSALKNMGIPGAFVNSSLTQNQIRLVLQNIRLGVYKIIYVAPERLLTQGFLEAIAQQNISLVAVDEAHCISQWGQDFRPGYLRIVDFLSLLPKRPVVSAFTATATYEVRKDIKEILRLREPLEIITGYDRPNLRFEVLKPKKKADALLELLAQRKEKSGIIYCSTRKDVEKVCEILRGRKLPATRYHAGLSDQERHENQEDFVYDRCRIMVATNAFGMGIDKSNVGFVIHYNMPQSLEAYYQEAGRAGRDGEPGDCILLYSKSDILTAKFLIEQSGENDALTEEERQEVRKKDLIRLKSMISYCNSSHCLRAHILEYFGEQHSEACGNCSSCSSVMEEVDMTEQAKMILSGIYRIHDRLGYWVGASLVAQSLHGSKNQRVMELGLNRLSTYGIMKDVRQPLIRDLIEELERQGYLVTDPAHGAVKLTGEAREVLFQDKQVKRLVQAAQKQEPKKEENRAVQDTEALLEGLKELRIQIARKENMPLYIIFSNATLQEMARKAPATVEELLRVSGVGKYKAERYGEAFLNLIRKHRQSS